VCSEVLGEESGVGVAVVAANDDHAIQAKVGRHLQQDT
jgi:hypothetical protein